MNKPEMKVRWICGWPEQLASKRFYLVDADAWDEWQESQLAIARAGVDAGMSADIAE